METDHPPRPPSVPASRRIAPNLKSLYLERVSSSRAFLRSVQLRRLLNFLGERTISDERPPTELEIAVQVLHRGAEFDPRSDSLVRKEMSRLRSKLADYYEMEGIRDAVIIQCGGAYQLEFRWRTGVVPAERDETTRCLLVLPPRANAAEHDFGELFYDVVMLHLSALTGCRLVSRTSARFYAAQPRDVRVISSECGADAVLEIDVRRFEDECALLLWLVDGATGLIRSTLRVDGRQTQEELAEKVVRWLIQQGEVHATGNVASHM